MEVESPVVTPSRPLARILIVVAIVAGLAVANDLSSASKEHALRTSDASRYVEKLTPTRFEPARLPTGDPTSIVTTTADPTTVAPTAATAVTVEAVTVTVMVTSPDIATTVVPDAVIVAPNVAEPLPAGAGDADGGGTASVSRAIPDAPAAVTGPAVVSPWADRTSMTAAGYVATSIGCASGTSASSLDAFFRDRSGPVIGLDYQHVYALGGDRYLWLFQDAFIDYSGTATTLSQAVFAHNTAMVQDGACFTLYHRGSINKPTSFELGNGGNPIAKWFWPMGGQTFDGKLSVYWAQMERDGYDPHGADGLGWHPVQTWIAVYDAKSLNRLAFEPAANSGVSPIYGYAVASDDAYTYLFGNSFEQNLQREGGYANGPHSATKMFLARVPRGQLGAALEYRAGDAWTPDASQATPVSQRYWAENPMQPRYFNGQWVAATKADGYWGDSLTIDVANDSWGPWTTVEDRGLSPRGGDPKMNTYHAYLMPWLDGGSLVVSVSNNARNMLRDAWPNPARYRPMFFRAALVAPPPRPDETTTTIEEATTTLAETTTSGVGPATTVVPDTTTTTAVPPTTTTSTTPPTTTTSPPTTTTSPPTTITSPPTTTDASTTTTIFDPTSTSSSTVTR